MLMICQTLVLSGQAGFEQYYYLQDKKPGILVPIIHIQNKKNWYAEGRYNYEELRSFSLYFGKNFSRENTRLSYSLTPILGGIIGRLRGGSAGINANVEYGDFFFCSQSQFTFTPKASENNFAFSWSDAGYQPFSWFYFGLSVQQTHYTKSNCDVQDRGMVIGFIAGKWTLPMYGFSLQSNRRYFVIGINLGLGTTKTHL